MPSPFAIGAGLAAAAFLFSRKGTVPSTLTASLPLPSAAAFAACLPSGGQPLAPTILQVAATKNIDPFILAAIIARESNFGAALKNGTGDFAPRNPATWGNSLPPDGLGWGRGLMQIDYGSFKDWLNANDWRSAPINIAKGADILLGKQRYLQGASIGNITLVGTNASIRGITAGTYRDRRPLTGADLVKGTIAAFNVGEGGVMWNAAARVDLDTATAHGNYASDVLGRAAAYRALLK